MQENVVTIRALSHDGRGIANVGGKNGKTIFIENALPNETVEFIKTKQHSRYDEGKAVQIINKSFDRITPACPHFESCGGCQLQHLSSEAQIHLKQSVLLEQLEHFGGVVPQTIFPPIQGPFYGYRRKARISVKFVNKKNKVLIGFHEKRSYKIADLTGCETLDPKVGKLLPLLQSLIESLEAHKAIPQIEIAIGDIETALVFRHLEKLENSDLTILEEFAKNHDISLYLQPGALDSIHCLWPRKTDLKLYYSLPDWDLKLYFTPLDFIQVNGLMNQKMIQQAVTLLEPNANDIILDLFCGLGNFTLPFATIAKKVIGVEGNKSMVQLAKENAKINQLTNVNFFVDNLDPKEETDLDLNLNLNHWTQESFNKVILDPPRTGANGVMKLLAKLKPSHILYVSCNPATLARDLGVLVNIGYELKTVGIMDMFPQTMHVESMALLTLK